VKAFRPSVSFGEKACHRLLSMSNVYSSRPVARWHVLCVIALASRVLSSHSGRNFVGVFDVGAAGLK
jgi:hypothetical protein